ncbi:hypothetical protein ACFRFD_39515, partial [Streptomyces sp. NPDC056632]
LTEQAVHQLLTDTGHTLGPRTHIPGHTTDTTDTPHTTVEQALTDAGLPLHDTDHPQRLTFTGHLLLSHWATHLTTTHPTPHTPETAHTTAHTIAHQLANNPDPYIPSLTQWLLPPTTPEPTTKPTRAKPTLKPRRAQPIPAKINRRDVPVKIAPRPQLPAPLIPHTPDTVHITARQLANNPDPYIPSLTEGLLSLTTPQPTTSKPRRAKPTTKPTPAKSNRRGAAVTPLPWPQLPARLTIGPELQKLRDIVDAFIYKPEEIRTDGDHFGAALLISLQRTQKDKALDRKNYVENMAPGLSGPQAFMRLLGIFQAAGAFVTQGKKVEVAVMSPAQLRDVIILKEWPGADGKYITSHAAAQQLWGRFAASRRSHVVDGVWSMTNWKDGGVLQLLADAVAEIALDLRGNNLPLDERFIASLIWRDHRAIEDQAVIIHAILRARGIIEQPWPQPPIPLTAGPNLQLLRDTVDQFRHNERERLRTDGDRVRTTLLISLKRTPEDAPLVRQKYVDDLTSELSDDLARMQLLGMFQAAGAFIGQGATGGANLMNPTQLRDVVILKEWPEINGQHTTSYTAASQIWITALAKTRQHVVDGVWMMTNWEDGGVLQLLADAVAEIALDLRGNNLPLDERFIASLIWRDHRAIEDQAVIIHAILLARGIIKPGVKPQLPPRS